jgi:hypothetical protein
MVGSCIVFHSTTCPLALPLLDQRGLCVSLGSWQIGSCSSLFSCSSQPNMWWVGVGGRWQRCGGEGMSRTHSGPGMPSFKSQSYHKLSGHGPPHFSHFQNGNNKLYFVEFNSKINQLKHKKYSILHWSLLLQDTAG